MPLELFRVFASTAAGATGVVIGLGFGFIQQAAARKYERLQSSGKFETGWALVPGSMRRTAYFLMTLAAVQVICPFLFADGYQWWVSGGVVAGYGWGLYQKLRRTMAAR